MPVSPGSVKAVLIVRPCCRIETVLHDPFLIDECLSPDLVAIAHNHGYDATHVLYRGLSGAADHALMPVIRREGFVFVTSNRRDFLRLYARETLHPGLIIIVPGQALLEQQATLFEAALVALGAAGDLVNKVMDVLSDGSVQISDLPVTPA